MNSGPLAHFDVLFQTEQLLFNCQKGSDSECQSVSSDHKHVACVNFYLMLRLYRHSKNKSSLLFFM